MTPLAIRDLAALYAAGALTPEERGQFHSQLSRASRDEREDCAALQELAAVLSAAMPPVEPPSAVRDALVGRVASAGRRTDEAGFSFTWAAEGWQRHPLPGVTFKELRVDRENGQATLLFKLDPHTRFPPHHHSGDEQCLVIDGDLAAAGRRLGPGDFHCASAGSAHAEIYSDGGCTILLIVAAEDYVPRAKRMVPVRPAGAK